MQPTQDDAGIRSTLPSPGLPNPVVNRRTLMKTVGWGVAATAVPALLSGCSSGSSRTAIRLEETKFEVIPYFDKLIKTFNRSQSSVVVSHDATSSLIADFVRGNPPDIDCDNYNLTTSIFVSRGVLADLQTAPKPRPSTPTCRPS